MTVDELQDVVEGLYLRLTYGCGNHGCLVRPPPGMGTNAICRCTPVKFSKELLEIAAELEKCGNRWGPPE